MACFTSCTQEVTLRPTDGQFGTTPLGALLMAKCVLRPRFTRAGN